LSQRPNSGFERSVKAEKKRALSFLLHGERSDKLEKKLKFNKGNGPLSGVYQNKKKNGGKMKVSQSSLILGGPREEIEATENEEDEWGPQGFRSLEFGVAIHTSL